MSFCAFARRPGDVTDYCVNRSRNISKTSIRDENIVRYHAKPMFSLRMLVFEIFRHRLHEVSTPVTAAR